MTPDSQSLVAFSLIPGLLLLLAGCASSGDKTPFEAPPETRPPVVTEGTGTDAPPAPESESKREPLTVVIEDGEAEESARQTLLEAAQAERERRRTAAPPQIVITDENLVDFATGELTIVEGAAAPAATSEGEESAVQETVSQDEEDYWRTRVRQARSDWGSAVDEIEHLESRVAELRRRFYEEDDPYYRDSQIKPSWDRSLERLAEARDTAESQRIRVLEILEEGRRNGAYPGWLREGLELEPDWRPEDEDEAVQEHETREPSVVEPVEPPAP